ncbi:hypothetical protein D3C74_363010 [compost metagenome]
MAKEKVRNFSSSPSPPNCPSISSPKITSPSAAPTAAYSGWNSMHNVSGMNAKYSTESSIGPRRNSGISSVNMLDKPYRDMERTKIIIFCEDVRVYRVLRFMKGKPPLMSRSSQSVEAEY